MVSMATELRLTARPTTKSGSTRGSRKLSEGGLCRCTWRAGSGSMNQTKIALKRASVAEK